MEIVPPNHKLFFQVSVTFVENYPKIAKYFNNWDAQTTKELFLKFEQMIDFLRSQYNFWTVKREKIFAVWDKSITKGNRLSRQLQYLKKSLNVSLNVADDTFETVLHMKFWEKNFIISKYLTDVEVAEAGCEYELIKEACANKFFINWKIDGFDKK